MTELVMDSAQAAYRVDFVSTIGAGYFSKAGSGAAEQSALEITIERGEAAALAHPDGFDIAP